MDSEAGSLPIRRRIKTPPPPIHFPRYITFVSPFVEMDSSASTSVSAPPPLGTPYAIPVPNTARPDRTPVYRHWRAHTEDPSGNIASAPEPDRATLHAWFDTTARRQPEAPCLGHRPWDADARVWAAEYTWLSYSEVARRRTELGKGIREVHLGVGVAGDAKFGVGVWAQNRREWQITGK